MIRQLPGASFALSVEQTPTGKYLSICSYGNPNDPEHMRVVDVEQWDIPDRRQMMMWFDYTITEQPWRIKH